MSILVENNTGLPTDLLIQGINDNLSMQAYPNRHSAFCFECVCLDELEDATVSQVAAELDAYYKAIGRHFVVQTLRNKIRLFNDADLAEYVSSHSH